MKFKIDENLPAEIKHLLTQAGHDALTIKDQKLTGNPDMKVAAICVQESRVFVTCDLDFSDIRAYPPKSYPGIMVIRSDRQDKSTIVELFSSALDLLSREPINQQLWIIEKDRVRVRS
jgi:predicted nuclease of predicted toxin-antitoxin system